MEICLTACILCHITVRRKKRRHCNFTFGENPAFRRKGVSEPVFKDETVSSRKTIIYFTVRCLIGWCASFPHKSFLGRKKHVRTADKARLIRTFVNNDSMKSHRRRGAPWAAWASSLPSCWKMTHGRCPILLQKDVSPVHAATVTIKRLRGDSGSGSSLDAPPSRGHRGIRTYPTSFTPMGSREGRDLQTWTPRPPRAKNHGYGVC